MDGLGELVKIVSALWAWATTTTGVPTALVAVAVFFVGLQQYRTKLRWDRQALVAKEVKRSSKSVLPPAPHCE
jgi:hypothetical protein